jgi:hypothetical protein
MIKGLCSFRFPAGEIMQLTKVREIGSLPNFQPLRVGARGFTAGFDEFNKMPGKDGHLRNTHGKWLECILDG